MTHTTEELEKLLAEAMTTEAMKPKTPDRIYLIPDGEGSFMWCDDPAPGTDMDEADAVAYVRAALSQESGS